MTDNRFDNSGVLFKAKPNENPKWAQYEGNATVNGVDYWIKAWVKEGKNGKFFSLAFKPKDAPKSAPAPQQQQDIEDDIPF